MATCATCVHTGSQTDKHPCSECKGFSKYKYNPQRTIADTVRAMTDEQLADNFHKLYELISQGTMNDLSDLFCDGKAGCITKHGMVRCNPKKERAWVYDRRHWCRFV